jgi:alkanesulfonate monooxygenase SsuD/methylene tetrahydromethanopterin reductase-like flavin-dependent oxidoreductase (luciferase family)
VTRSLAVGVQMPEVERHVPWRELRDIARAVEDGGFDSLWVGDHLLYRSAEGVTGPWEAWATLAALAEATERVTIGPLVAATAFHNPAVLAKTAATIDEISDGRFVFGIGAGWNRDEFDAFGIPFDHRASRFAEAFDIIRRLLSGDVVSVDGRFHSVTDCELVPRPRPGGPPLMIGSQGPVVLRATLPYVDAWNGWYAWFGNTPEGAANLMASVDAACIDVGRDPATIRRTVSVLVEAPGGVGNVERAKRWDDPPAVTGPPEAIAEQLAGFAAVDIDEVQLVVDPITTESVAWLSDVLTSPALTH